MTDIVLIRSDYSFSPSHHVRVKQNYTNDVMNKIKQLKAQLLSLSQVIELYAKKLMPLT